MSDKYYHLLIHKSRFQKSKKCFKYTLFLSICIVLLTMILCILNNHGLKYQQNNLNSNQTKNLEIRIGSTTSRTTTQHNIVEQKYFDSSKEELNLPPIDFEDVVISNKTVVIEGNIVSVYN